MRKKMVSLSHSCGLLGDYFSSVKCELIYLFCYCVFHEAYTPKDSLNQMTGTGAFLFWDFPVAYLLYALHSEVILY